MSGHVRRVEEGRRVTPPQRNVVLTALAACLAAVGCNGGGPLSRSGLFPNVFTHGEAIRSHAKPPGFRYYRNFDQASVKLEVRPLDSVSPVKTRHVVLATIYDAQNRPLHNRRVEWVLEGAGHIL